MLPTQATHPEEGGSGQSSPFPEGDRRVRQRRHPAAEQHEKRVAEMRNHAAAVRLEESLETKQRAPQWPSATDPQSHSPVVPEALVSAMVAEAHAAANATGVAQTVVGEFIVALGVAEPGTRVNELLNSMQHPEMRRLHQLLLSSRAALSRLDSAGGIAGWAAADRDLMDARLGEVVRLVDQRTKSLGKLRAAPEPTPREQMRRQNAVLSLPALWESAAKEMERAAKEMEARTHLVAAGWLEGCAKSPKGCALVPYRMRGNDGHCDVCKAKQPDGAVMASCRAEDYDVCTKCIGQLSRDASQRAAPPLHVVQAAPLHGFQTAAGQLPLGGSSLATQPLEEFWRGRFYYPVPPEMIGAMVEALETHPTARDSDGLETGLLASPSEAAPPPQEELAEEEERQSLRRELQQQQQKKAEAEAKFDALMARVPPEAPLLRARTQTQLDSLRSDMSQAEEQASRLRQRIEQLERQRCASSLAEPNLLDELVARLDLDLRSRAERDRPPRSPSFLDCPPAPRGSDAAAPLIDGLPNEVLPALKGLVGVTFERNSHPSAGPGGALYERFLNQCADAAASALAGAGTSPDGAGSAAIAAPFTVEEMEYTWCFGGFWDSSTYIDGKLYSPVFTSGQYNWRLLLFPGGNKAPYLAAYLDVPDSATLPMGWTRDAHFTLTIHNQKEPSRNVVKDADHQFSVRACDWGWKDELVTLAELRDASSGFVVNGALTVSVKLRAKVWAWPRPQDPQPRGEWHGDPTLLRAQADALLCGEAKSGFEVHLLLHGTLRENFPSILSTGLDPARRGLHGQALGRGDYFARNASYSIRYCDSGSFNSRAPLGSLLGAPLSSALEHTRDGQMLVFAVLLSPRELGTLATKGICCVKGSACSLPLGVLSWADHRFGDSDLRGPRRRQMVASGMGFGMMQPAPAPVPGGPGWAQHASLGMPPMPQAPPPPPPIPPATNPFLAAPFPLGARPAAPPSQPRPPPTPEAQRAVMKELARLRRDVEAARRTCVASATTAATQLAPETTGPTAGQGPLDSRLERICVEVARSRGITVREVPLVRKANLAMKALGLPCDSLLADSLSLSTKIELMEGHLFYHVARSSSPPTADAQEAASAPSPAPKAAVVEAEGVVDVAVDESDLMTWTVQMAMPRDSPLGADLASYAAAVKGGGGSLAATAPLAATDAPATVTLEVEMPPNFPAAPPFVRVVAPRFAFHTGHVTVGGSVCMELLTSAGWRPEYTLRSVLVQVRAAMIAGGGRLDPRRPQVPYSKDEARRAFWRVAQQHGWERPGSGH